MYSQCFLVFFFHISQHNGLRLNYNLVDLSPLEVLGVLTITKRAPERFDYIEHLSRKKTSMINVHLNGTSSPCHWQQVEEQAPKPVGWLMCFLLMTFVPVQKLSVMIYIYIYACMYVYIIYALLYESCFLWFTICVLVYYNSLIPGCLWLLVFLNNTLILGIWCSTILHLPGCFCPWAFFQNIVFNMVPSDPFLSHLATQLGNSAGEFQALQLIVLATFGVVD